MQTFLPYADFERSASVLDTKRLGKQRVEALQILRALTRPGYGWANHPAVLMWKGFEEALGRYGFACCEAWTGLGFGDTCAVTLAEDLRLADVHDVRTQAELDTAGALPPWLGDEALHRSHRSSLVRKDPGHYGRLFPDVPDDLPYVWPIRSPAVLEAERRKAERLRRKRSRAAEKGWRTRRANASRPDV
ncbi:MAG TPA: MSMEG_6728 family protein [Nocardioides sp.]|uniref:MSMEG_6728 family protein n=1 Tax=Nocardioides sp. TaxID=35761 RepID=UPI002F42BBA3